MRGTLASAIAFCRAARLLRSDAVLPLLTCVLRIKRRKRTVNGCQTRSTGRWKSVFVISPSTSNMRMMEDNGYISTRRIDAPIRPIAGVSWKSRLWPTQVACDVGFSDASSPSTPTHASMPTRSTRFDRHHIDISEGVDVR